MPGMPTSCARLLVGGGVPSWRPSSRAAAAYDLIKGDGAADADVDVDGVGLDAELGLLGREFTRGERAER
jgi:hypothetical protein